MESTYSWFLPIPFLTVSTKRPHLVPGHSFGTFAPTSLSAIDGNPSFWHMFLHIVNSSFSQLLVLGEYILTYFRSLNAVLLAVFEQPSIFSWLLSSVLFPAAVRRKSCCLPMLPPHTLASWQSHLHQGAAFNPSVEGATRQEGIHCMGLFSSSDSGSRARVSTIYTCVVYTLVIVGFALCADAMEWFLPGPRPKTSATTAAKTRVPCYDKTYTDCFCSPESPPLRTKNLILSATR